MSDTTQAVKVFEEACDIALPEPDRTRHRGAKVNYGTRAHYMPEFCVLVVEHAASGAISSAFASRKTAHVVENSAAAVRMAVTMADAWAAEVKGAVSPTEPRTEPRVRFEFEGVKYSTALDFERLCFARLPDGRCVEATGGWSESYPPQPRSLRIASLSAEAASYMAVSASEDDSRA